MNNIDLLIEIGRWSVDGLWLPMIVWTIVALPTFVIQRWTPGVSSYTRYWTAVGLTAALPIGLMAGAFVAFDTRGVQDVAAMVLLPAFEPTVSAGSVSSAFSWTMWHSAGALTVVAGLLATLRVASLVRATIELHSFRSGGLASPPEHVQAQAARLGEQLGLSREVRIGVSDAFPSPLTFGWRAPVVVLPRQLFEVPNDLRLALAHEFVHIRRHDYLWQWCEHVIGAVFFIHPFVSILRNEASVLREITCDADVLAHFGDRSRYARLLYQYSTADTARGRLAIGILLRENHLKSRISAMKNLLDITRLNHSKRVGLGVAATLLTLAVLAVACTDALVESRPDGGAPAHADLMTSDEDAYVVVEQMPELVGGLASIMENLHYPALAKKAGIQGRVIVQFIVDEEGSVVDPKIVRGIGSGLDEAALEAVRKAEFKPGMQRGEAVRVKMSLPVTFKLGGNAEAPSAVGGAELGNVSTEQIDVDQMPKLEGGLAALQQNIKYPEMAKRAGIEGRVIVEFTVTESGSTRDAWIVRGVGAGIDEEALRAVRNARFEPAKKDGKAVAMKLSLPITFSLASDRASKP